MHFQTHLSQPCKLRTVLDVIMQTCLFLPLWSRALKQHLKWFWSSCLNLSWKNAKGKRTFMHLLSRRRNKRCIKLALKVKRGVTHVTEEVDEWVHAGVAHRQPVRAEPHYVYVLEAAKINKKYIGKAENIVNQSQICIFLSTHLLTCGAMTDKTW